MKLKRTWAIYLSLGSLAASSHAQHGLFDGLHALHIHAALQAGLTQSDTQTSDINNGKKVVRVTTERDSSGKMIRKTTETDEYSGDKNDPKRKLVKTTKVEEDYSKPGKPSTTTTTTEIDDEGSKTTTTKDKGDGRAVKTGEEERDAIGRIKKETECDDKGRPAKVSEYDPPGHPTPKKVTEFEDGKKKTETENDAKGKPTKVTEFEKGKKKKEIEFEDGKPVRETEFDDRGRKRLVTDLDAKGNAKKVTLYHPNGQKKEEVEAKDGKPTKKTTYDDKGNKTGEETYSPMPFAVVPSHAEAGQPFLFTVVDLNGQVVPNEEVVIDGGPHGKFTATSDLNGVVVARTPDHWRSARVIVGSFVAAMLLDRATQGSPSGMGSPGAIGSIPYNGKVDPTTLTMTVGGRNAKILSASASEINFVTPAGLAPGPAAVQFFYPGSEPFDGRPFTVVTIEWEPVRGPLTVGQKLTRNLVVKGTSEPVRVRIVDPTNDAAKVLSGGVRTSTGGTNNVIPVDMHMVQTGSFNVRAELATQGQTDYEKDLRKAEVAERDAAGWEDSASADSDSDRARLKRMAAGFSKRAANAWKKGADARLHGKDAEAESWEKAAQNWEEAADQSGAKGNEGRAGAAADEARMWERKGGGS